MTPVAHLSASPPATEFDAMAHVLIVDDDEADRLLLRSLLADEGHELYFATNGEEAMKLYLRHPIEVVVTDIQMPRGDGIELISALKGLDRDAAIVAVSGKGAQKLQAAQRAGARSILAKPVTKDDLISAVRRAAEPGEPGGPTG